MENDGSKSFQNLLVTTYNSITGATSLANGSTLIVSAILSFLRSGAYVSDNVTERENYSRYLSSVAYSKDQVYIFSSHPTSVRPQYNNYSRGYGFSLRCLAR